jgi:UDP-N-acetylmuramate dehydrogenase
MSLIFPKSLQNSPSVTFDVPLGKQSTMKTGGNAACVFEPQSIRELSRFCMEYKSIEKIVLGRLSNVVIRDHGINKIVIQLKRLTQHVIDQNNNFVILEAGMSNYYACQKMTQYNYSGIEFLIGIPGTIGGAVATNAGAYGSEISDVLVWCETMDNHGRIHRLSKNDLNMHYRCGGLPAEAIVTKACFSLRKSSKEDINAQHTKITTERATKINISSKYGTAGSMFKNPEHCNGLKAWQLIEAAGCRGLTRDGAMISDKHANFLINTGTATVAALEELTQEVKQRVLDTSGILLELEIEFIGDSTPHGSLCHL